MEHRRWSFGAQDEQGRYGWIAQVLGRLGYRQLPRLHRGLVLAYIQRLSPGGHPKCSTGGHSNCSTWPPAFEVLIPAPS
jgi:hypothetical protein